MTASPAGAVTERRSHPITDLAVEDEPLQQENAEIIRASFDAYQRGDEAAMLGLASPEAVVTQFPDQLDVRDFHGREGVKQVMADWIGTW